MLIKDVPPSQWYCSQMFHVMTLFRLYFDRNMTRHKAKLMLDKRCRNFRAKHLQRRQIHFNAHGLTQMVRFSTELTFMLGPRGLILLSHQELDLRHLQLKTPS